MGVDGDQDTHEFQPIFNNLFPKCFASGALPRTPLGAYGSPRPPAGTRWVTPLQRTPQNCGPQGPETPRSATARSANTNTGAMRASMRLPHCKSPVQQELLYDSYHLNMAQLSDFIVQRYQTLDMALGLILVLLSISCT